MRLHVLDHLPYATWTFLITRKSARKPAGIYFSYSLVEADLGSRCKGAGIKPLGGTYGRLPNHGEEASAYRHSGDSRAWHV